MNSEINHTIDPTLDPALRTLTKSRHRSVLYRLHETPENVVSFEALVDYIIQHDPASTNEDTVAIDLHHIILPKLTEYGWIDYDTDDETIRYARDASPEKLITGIHDLESNRQWA